MGNLGSDARSLQRIERAIPEFGRLIRTRSTSASGVPAAVEVSLPAEEQATVAFIAEAYDVTPEIVVMALVDWLGLVAEADIFVHDEADAGEGMNEAMTTTDEHSETLLLRALASLDRANAIAEQTILEDREADRLIAGTARKIDVQLTQLDRSMAELIAGSL